MEPCARREHPSYSAGVSCFVPQCGGEQLREANVIHYVDIIILFGRGVRLMASRVEKTGGWSG